MLERRCKMIRLTHDVRQHEYLPRVGAAGSFASLVALALSDELKGEEENRSTRRHSGNRDEPYLRHDLLNELEEGRRITISTEERAGKAARKRNGPGLKKRIAISDQDREEGTVHERRRKD